MSFKGRVLQNLPAAPRPIRRAGLLKSRERNLLEIMNAFCRSGHFLQRQDLYTESSQDPRSRSSQVGAAGVVEEYVEPLGPRILVRKDESRHETRGGIVLPDQAEIPTITGRVVEISAEVSHDVDFPVRKYDKVLFHPKRAIPVDFEPDNLLYVVPIEDVVAVFRRTPRGAEKQGSDDSEADDADISPDFLDDEEAD
jgi:chaperonin GroES